jgi:hypothetical protein
MKGHVEVGILTDEDRRLYGALADILIPHAEGMPSATEAEVPSRWLEDALRFRPDLETGLRTALEIATNRSPEEAVEVLNRENAPAFESLGTLTAGAYFLNPEVRCLIGYPGQVETQPRDDMETYLDMLERVVDRGQVYRDESENRTTNEIR